MADTYDVAVVGLGAMGSAAAYQLSATPGLSVVGVDAHRPPHPYGSTHGDTRATRAAPFEGPELVSLVRRSVAIYDGELSEANGRRLFERSGGLIIGRPGTPGYHNVEDPFRSTVAAAEHYGVDYELLSREEVHRRHPAVRMAEDEQAYFEPDGGYLYAEECVRAHLRQAERQGAELRFGQQVARIEAVDGGARLTTENGTIEAGSVIVAAGSWVRRLMPEFAQLFQLQRLTLFWFELMDKRLYEAYRTMPRIGWAYGSGVYAFPAIDGPEGGVKVASEDFTEITSPEAIDRRVSPEETTEMFRTNVLGRLQGLGPRSVRAATCMYTMTPDSRFIIDRHPEAPQIILASPCSGHGFKYSAAIGEALAELVSSGTTSQDISSFGLDRFARGSAHV